MTLDDIAARRITRIFLPDATSQLPCLRDDSRTQKLATDTHGRELVWFHEYFHGDTGSGLGASHQTGWTALITRCMNMVGRHGAF